MLVFALYYVYVCQSWLHLNTLKGSDAKTVLVPIANGSEEMEAVITIDVLRRAGCAVTVASVEDSLAIKASRNVNLTADCSIKDCVEQAFDCIAVPVSSQQHNCGQRRVSDRRNAAKGRKVLCR